MCEKSTLSNIMMLSIWLQYVVRGLGISVQKIWAFDFYTKVGAAVDCVAASLYEFWNRQFETLPSLRLPRVVAVPAGMTKPAAPACMYAADQSI